MVGHAGRTRTAVLIASAALWACLPLLLGQGCGGTIVPVTPGVDVIPDSGAGAGGNAPPVVSFVSPLADVQVEVGDPLDIAFSVTDPDSNALIDVFLDRDGILGNGNEITIPPTLQEDATGGYVSIRIDTAELGLTPGPYSIVVRATDLTNVVILTAPGRLLLFAAGTIPGSASPTIVVTRPQESLSVAQGSTFDIAYCGRDRDNGPGGVATRVVLLLDFDRDPTNDLSLTGPSDAAGLDTLCSGAFPKSVNGAIILGCAVENDCTSPATPTVFPVTVDATLIPPRAGGDPYHVRGTIWDQANPPVHSYARGTVHVVAAATGSIDLAQVGRTVAGARFMGFRAGGLAGSTGTTLGDFDRDGAADFIIVSRFGNMYERGSIGSAHLVYGRAGRRFGGDISLNSFGISYRGAAFSMSPGGSATAGGDTEAPYFSYEFFGPLISDGITSVSTIQDVNGDGRPEILFGMPYVEALSDMYDDDPCDKDDLCYPPYWPNPGSDADPGNDDISGFDFEYSTPAGEDQPERVCREVNEIPTINQGYVIVVSSLNNLQDTVVDLGLVGQHDPDGFFNAENTGFSGDEAPLGARLRGGWFGADYGFEPDNGFGLVVSSMPDMGNGRASPQRDGQAEYLYSVPYTADRRGMVIMGFGGNYETFIDQEVKSMPEVLSIGDCSRWVNYMVDRRFVGAQAGDELGYARAAGDFNDDGHQDILMGAPGADRGGRSDTGVVYILYGRLDLSNADLATTNPPRIEIEGANRDDRFGQMQVPLGDVDGDGIADVAFSAANADSYGGINAGLTCILFGSREHIGEGPSFFRVNQVGTPQLPGATFHGASAGDASGTVIANAGDFNGDGYADLLIVAPNAATTVSGQSRRGVAYLVFGGPYLKNKAYSLSDIQAGVLPGIVFAAPYIEGTADAAPIDWAGAAGDVDGDSYGDILIGVSRADYVNPLDPSQRRADAGECYLIYGSNVSGNQVVQ